MTPDKPRISANVTPHLCKTWAGTSPVRTPGQTGTSAANPAPVQIKNGDTWFFLTVGNTEWSRTARGDRPGGSRCSPPGAFPPGAGRLQEAQQFRASAPEPKRRAAGTRHGSACGARRPDRGPGLRVYVDVRKAVTRVDGARLMRTYTLWATGPSFAYVTNRTPDWRKQRRSRYRIRVRARSIRQAYWLALHRVYADEGDVGIVDVREPVEEVGTVG